MLTGLNTSKTVVLAVMIILLAVFSCAGCSTEAEDEKQTTVEQAQSSAEKEESKGTSTERVEKSEGKVYEVTAEQDYRKIVPLLKPGDELVLHEGVYDGHIRIRTSGLPDRPIKIMGYGNGEARPILRYEGRSSNLWEVYADNLTISNLEFQPLQKNVFGIRIGDTIKGVTRRNITVRDCVFRNSGGDSLNANHSGMKYENIKVIGNQFIGVRATPIYIGNHDGSADVTGFVFKGNYIDASKITRIDIVGYGIQLKLNVTGGLIKNNLIVGSKGPGIMVYGAFKGDNEYSNTVEGNIVVGSRTNAGIVVGDGPSIARNNIVLGCSAGGIKVNDYKGRGLLRNVTITGNAAAYNSRFDFAFTDINEYTEDMEIIDNLAVSKPVVPGYRNLKNIEKHVEVSDNRIVSGNEKLEQQISRIKNIHPDMESLKMVWPKLERGPYDLQQLIDILKTIRSE
jgi:hypothetical protein